MTLVVPAAVLALLTLTPEARAQEATEPPDAESSAPIGEFHTSEVRHKKRVVPKYPKAAKALGAAHTRCVARVTIDTIGNPVAVEVLPPCPEVFHEATEDAVMASSWYPMRAGGQPVPAQFQVVFLYVGAGEHERRRRRLFRRR